MALFSVEINDADVNRILDAIAANYRRSEKVPNPDYNQNIPESPGNPKEIDNPESKAAFANRIVREFLAEHTHAHELQEVRKAAESNVPAHVTINDPHQV